MSDQPSGMKKGLTAYGDPGFSLFLRKAFLKAMGYSEAALDRPVVGITNTHSDYNPCHATVPELIAAIKRGVVRAGGLPLAFPTVSLHESFAHPTSMFLRNLMAMDTEEMIRAQPMDAVVLVGGCDKTIPAQLMAAASAKVPALAVVTGPMLTGFHRGERLGACTDCRRFWAKHRAGEIDAAEIAEVGGKLMPTAGTCMVMGTASTVACMTEALGMMLPGGAAIPAVHGERLRFAEESGRRAVALAREDLTPDKVMTAPAFANALTTLQAIGGSTNALIHFTAVAGRLGIAVDLDAFDRMGAEIPVVVDLKPSGRHFMEDLHEAGGLSAVLREIADHLDLDALTVTGRSLGENIAGALKGVPGGVVRTLDDPLSRGGALAILRGNLAPGGAVIKQSAATPALLRHRGRAVVFDSLADLSARIDDPDLEVAPEDILVLRNAGPKGAPGMPEAGTIPLPRKLAALGVTDMVRISDARMSGTAFGTIVLHVTPEAAVGGPLALVESGDVIELNVAARKLELHVPEDELARRRARWRPPDPGAERGYARLHLDHVQQADKGCDLDFMTPADVSECTP